MGAHSRIPHVELTCPAERDNTVAERDDVCIWSVEEVEMIYRWLSNLSTKTKMYSAHNNCIILSEMKIPH